MHSNFIFIVFLFVATGVCSALSPTTVAIACNIGLRLTVYTSRNLHRTPALIRLGRMRYMRLPGTADILHAISCEEEKRPLLVRIAFDVAEDVVENILTGL